MLLLRFDLDGRRYALPARAVEELLPLLPIEPFPHAPEILVGLTTWRDKPIPVLDLCAMLARRPCRETMLTRIAVVKLPGERVIGLRVENLTGTLRIKEQELIDTAVRLEAAPYLGRVHGAGKELIQLIEVERFDDERFAGVLRPAP